MTTDAIIRTEQLTVGYGRALLPPISLTIQPGEIWAIVGENGSGKSTFVRTILRLLPPVGGRVVRRDGAIISYVPQRRADDDDVPARVVDYVLAGVDRGLSFFDPFFILKNATRATDAMRDANILELANRQFGELSEGQKQRVQIARALASGPNLIVLDEPTSAMDPGHELEMFELLERLKTSKNVAWIVISHHMAFVPKFASHTLFLDADRGVAIAGPTPEILGAEPFKMRYGVLV